MSNYDINSNPALVRLMIENEKEEYEKNYAENSKTLSFKFCNELRELGFEFEVSSQAKGFMPKHKDIILPIAIRYYKQARCKNEKNLFFMQFFQFKGFEEVVPMLLEDYYADDGLVDQWQIGSTLYTIRSKKYVDDYLRIISNPKYGIDRQMIVLLVGKLKVEPAIPILITLLEDNDVIGHAISALGNYRQEEFRVYFKRFLKHESGYYRREAKKAIKKLDNLEKINKRP